VVKVSFLSHQKFSTLQPNMAKSLLGCKQKALKFALSLALSECGEDSSSQAKSRENVQEERIGCFDVAGGDGKGTNRGEQDASTNEYRIL